MKDNYIDFCDLKRQWQTHHTAFIDAITPVFETGNFSLGQFAEKFEKDFASYCGVSYASSVSSGTSALFLALKAIGIGKGDEVIVPSNTFVASAWGIVYNGASPVFCDCTQDTWEIDANSVRKSITKNTKAILGVHLYGQPFDFDSIKAVADEYGLYVIEDCAQAHGALYKGRKTGSMGDAGCFSFYPTKNLGAFGDAGCVVTDNEKYINTINLLKHHATCSDGDHSEIGYNMRMDDLQSALLELKLKELDLNNEKRIEIAQTYKSNIENSGIHMQSLLPDCRHVYHLFVVTVDNRGRFIDYMKSKGIGCAVHYPVACHMQSAFANYKAPCEVLSNSEHLCSHCVSLPVYPELTQHEIERIVDACNCYKG